MVKWSEGAQRRWNWETGQEKVLKKVQDSWSNKLTTFLSQMKLKYCPCLALSFPQVLRNYKVRGKSRKQPTRELWIPASSKASPVLSVVRYVLFCSAIPTLFHLPFGQLMSWHRQDCPVEEGNVKHWCLFIWSLSSWVMRWGVCMVSPMQQF